MHKIFKKVYTNTRCYVIMSATKNKWHGEKIGKDCNY